MKLKIRCCWQNKNCGFGVSFGWNHYDEKGKFEFNGIYIGLIFCLIVFQFKLK